MQSTKQGDEKNNIDPGELSEPIKQNSRCIIFKTLYKSTIEAACKPVDNQNENQMSILCKLEWAEQGNLRELYDKHDIPWTRKIHYGAFENYPKFAKFDYQYTKRFKTWKLGFEKEVYGHNAINVSRSRTYIIRWMAPELAWCYQPELRIIIPVLGEKVEDSANKFPILLDISPLYKNKKLELDGLKSGESVLENDYPEIEEDIPEEVVPVVSLKRCVELDNPEAKFWAGYHLLYGHRGEKDPIQTRKRLKVAADENNHAESQCRYAASLTIDLEKRDL
ncbi:hypothetical protein F8M41_022726 [Gigaspora margarita]|uniref:Uncharacterized protein n=1 Tax=Gigaspora margarita TaxID=4874 RepID=A0A8H4AEK9_GIGMA|nr:hypothetical protein F8M41_022726 [Gigaspora margarita]